MPELPPHAADVMYLFGFPYGADCTDGLWWRAYEDGQIKLFAQCSDTFHWASADMEEIEEDDIPLLRQCLEDLKAVDEQYLLDVLFAARKRKMRPMSLWLAFRDPKTGEYDRDKPRWESHQLFLDAGPERDPQSEG